MQTNRDDFIIAIRSAFLKKGNQQRFSLIALIFFSIFIIVLGKYNFKAVNFLKLSLKELVYRTTFIVSVPENFVIGSYQTIRDHFYLYSTYENLKKDYESLKATKLNTDFLKSENEALKSKINDVSTQSSELLAKVIIDKKSPFLRSVIVNRGSKDNVILGMAVLDEKFLVGKVVEVNYSTSRVLLLSDLNSNVPATVAPQNIQAIITGTGDNYGKIKYIKDGLSDKFTEESIVYTSGTGAIFKSGVPIGRVRILEKNEKSQFNVEFYSDFSQLKYVFAEVVTKKEIQDTGNSQNENKNPIDAKIKILEDEVEIIEDSNIKFKEENDFLKIKINELNDKIITLNTDLSKQKEENTNPSRITQNNPHQINKREDLLNAFMSIERSDGIDQLNDEIDQATAATLDDFECNFLKYIEMKEHILVEFT